MIQLQVSIKEGEEKAFKFEINILRREDHKEGEYRIARALEAVWVAALKDIFKDGHDVTETRVCGSGDADKETP